MENCLTDDQVDVWYADLSPEADMLSYYEALLSAEETGAAARFHFEVHRVRYVAAHGVLRCVLGSYLNVLPQHIRFTSRQHGKPLVLYPETMYRFNLSHTGDTAAIAIAYRREVGIDIEAIRQGVDFTNIAGRFFTREEAAALSEIPQEERDIAFYNGWTRKEAYLKACGLGLSHGLDRVTVSFQTDEQPQILSTEDKERWTLHALSPPNHCVGALVVEQDGDEAFPVIRARHLDHARARAAACGPSPSC